MLSVENRVAARRAKAHAEHMANIASEAQAGTSSVQQRQAAQTAAFKAAEAEGTRFLAVERQRIAEASQMVAGPQLMQGVNIDPRGAQRAATAARA